MKSVMTLLISAGIVSFAAHVSAHGPGEGYGMGHGMMGWGYETGWFWPVVMSVLWIAAIVGVVFLVRWLVLSANRGRRAASEESALEILKKRYARGEISKDEYEKMKKDIT